MSIGKQEESQGALRLSYDQLPESLGHAFYDHLQRILLKGGFDRFAEELCALYYATCFHFLKLAPHVAR